MNETNKHNHYAEDTPTIVFGQGRFDECQWNADLRFVEKRRRLLDYLLRQGKYERPTVTAPGPDSVGPEHAQKGCREVLRDIRAHAELRRIPGSC